MNLAARIVKLAPPSSVLAPAPLSSGRRERYRYTDAETASLKGFADPSISSRSRGSSEIRVLLRPRWIVLHVIMLVSMPLFAVAGFWQLRRLDEKRTQNALIESRQKLPLVTSLEVRTSSSAVRGSRGRSTRPRTVILNGRPSRGRPGRHILTPLDTDSGTVVVDRGWVAPDEEYQTPEGKSSVEGILLPSEGRAPFTRGAGEAEQPTRIDASASTIRSMRTSRTSISCWRTEAATIRRSTLPCRPGAAVGRLAPVVRGAVVPVHPHRDRRLRAGAAASDPLALQSEGAGLNSKTPASRLRSRSRHISSSVSSG